MAEIITGIDGSDVSLHAVSWAAREAALRDQPLRVVHALQRWLYGMPEDTADPQIGRWARDDAARMLDEAASHARQVAPKATVATQLLSGDARPALLDMAQHASTLIVGGRGEGGFTGLLLGSVAYGVASRARCPVVVVQGPLSEVPHEVTVGVDGSAKSRAALEIAFTEASLRGVPLRAVYSWRKLGWVVRDAWPYSSSAAVVYNGHADEADARQTLEKAIAGPSVRHPDVKVIEKLDERHPVHTLVGASAHADLLVVGRRGGGGFPSMRLGSVSRGVLHHAQCPVMIVPK